MRQRGPKICMNLDAVDPPKIDSYKKQTPKFFELAEYLFNYCSHCGCEYFNMAVPHGTFAAFKVRQNEEKASKYQEMRDHSEELSPLQYNSKLMNSVWGMYNRYSVHNFKKNTDDGNALTFNQQLQTVGAFGSGSTGEKYSTNSKSSLQMAKKLLGLPNNYN